MFALIDNVAIVTGAGRGIGKAIALGFAEACANVVVTARTQSAIDEVASSYMTGTALDVGGGLLALKD